MDQPHSSHSTGTFSRGEIRKKFDRNELKHEQYEDKFSFAGTEHAWHFCTRKRSSPFMMTCGIHKKMLRTHI
jgi:hypothetical protein